jgi:dethiobiotin synthetase
LNPNSQLSTLNSQLSVFITGTNTGVGKTLLTAAWLRALRIRGIDALAVKPFCSGGRADVALLQAAQADAQVPDAFVNPFYFPEPLAPAVAARRHRRVITLPQALEHIRQAAQHCSALLIEGAGGLLAPLGRGFASADLIACLRCRVVVVAPNQLGAINHTLLTVRALPPSCHPPPVIVLMDIANPDPSAASNPAFLRKSLPGSVLCRLPYLGPDATRPELLDLNAKKIYPLLARALAKANYPRRFNAP